MEEYKLYDNTVTLKFDREKHVFHDEHGWIPSVTGITGIVDKSRPLMYWATREAGSYMLEKYKIVKKGYFDIPDKKEKSRRWREIRSDIKDKKIETSVLELANVIVTGITQYQQTCNKAADIGTSIHEWISDWILKKNPARPKNKKVINGIEAFLKFEKERKFEWVDSERLIYSKEHRYAGWLDATAMADGAFSLVDFKSSSGIFSEMFLQVGGYAIAYEEEHGREFEKMMIIQFGKETGEFQVKQSSDTAKDKEAFLSALSLKRRILELDYQ